MIGFRVDANEHIATGHMMRCVAIARQCISQGEECIFYLAEDKFIDILKTNRIQYKILHTKWDDLQSEIDILLDAITADKVDWLIIDSYQITNKYLSEINVACKVMYIDDMALETYDVSAVLRYYPWDIEKYNNKYRNTNVEVLAGSKYVPLREEFSLHQEVCLREQSILITTGGTDPYNITMDVLKNIEKDSDINKFDIYVIIGNMNIHEKQIIEYSQYYDKIHVLKNVNNMSYYMRKCSYAISAGGTTLFELCACKIPTICFSFADNQTEFTKKMHEEKIMLYAGDAREKNNIGAKIVQQLKRYNSNKQMCEEYEKKMVELVDGRGTRRIANFLRSK